MADPIQIEESSGNVFADLDIPEPDQAFAKAKITARICDIINERNLTQTEAAKILGVNQPKVSDLMRGKFDGFSCERLFRFLNDLNQEVEIVIRPNPHPGEQAGIHVQ